MTDTPQTRATWSQLEHAASGVVAGLRATSVAIDQSGLDLALIELIKVRVSQINGCAYCLQFHLNKARQLQVPQAKLDQLAVWHESALFTAPERAAFHWAEVLTRMATTPIADAAFAQLNEHFDETQRINLTAAIGLINGWNRLAGGLNIPPPTAR